MKNRRDYIAPDAQVILFAPREKIASWTSGNAGDSWWKKPGLLWWGETPAETASITINVSIEDEDGVNWKLD